MMTIHWKMVSFLDDYGVDTDSGSGVLHWATAMRIVERSLSHSGSMDKKLNEETEEKGRGGGGLNRVPT